MDRNACTTNAELIRTAQEANARAAHDAAVDASLAKARALLAPGRSAATARRRLVAVLAVVDVVLVAFAVSRAL